MMMASQSHPAEPNFIFASPRVPRRRPRSWQFQGQRVANLTTASLAIAQPRRDIAKIPDTPAAGAVDYYALLGVTRHADDEEITRAWRRLVLLHHPDKQGSIAGENGHEEGNGTVDIRLVNEARWILSDSGRRKQWEQAFFDGRGEVPQLKDHTPHISHHISLEEFSPHYIGRTASGKDMETGQGGLDHDVDADADADAEPSYYTHPCRCSGEFVITHQDLEDGIDVVGCEGCGEWVRVLYEVIEDE